VVWIGLFLICIMCSNTRIRTTIFGQTKQRTLPGSYKDRQMPASSSKVRVYDTPCMTHAWSPDPSLHWHNPSNASLYLMCASRHDRRWICVSQLPSPYTFDINFGATIIVNLPTTLSSDNSQSGSELPARLDCLQTHYQLVWAWPWGQDLWLPGGWNRVQTPPMTTFLFSLIDCVSIIHTLTSITNRF